MPHYGKKDDNEISKGCSVGVGVRDKGNIGQILLGSERGKMETLDWDILLQTLKKTTPIIFFTQASCDIRLVDEKKMNFSDK